MRRLMMLGAAGVLLIATHAVAAGQSKTIPGRTLTVTATVESILEGLAAGESVEQILESHPRLTREAVLEAVGFAAEALRMDSTYTL